MLLQFSSSLYVHASLKTRWCIATIRGIMANVIFFSEFALGKLASESGVCHYVVLVLMCSVSLLWLCCIYLLMVSSQVFKPRTLFSLSSDMVLCFSRTHITFYYHRHHIAFLYHQHHMFCNHRLHIRFIATNTKYFIATHITMFYYHRHCILC